MKKILCFLIAIFTLQVIFSQTLFSYGNKTVRKDEFLKAFNKTPNPDSNRAEALKEYLNLYINFKLKVQAAYDEKLNESADFKMESDNFKAQLAENIINAQANISQLISEAFQRSQKDIHLSQIFIPVQNNDTATAFQQINKAYADLQNGKNFEDAVMLYADPSLHNSKGDLGYITVFSLPYEIENIVYALKPGEFSKPYRSAIGYHIFKNDDERKAVGKRLVSQILFAIAPEATDAEKKAIKQKADSVYHLVTTGTDFETARQQFSNASETNIQSFEVGVGQYGNDFEQQVFALKNAGDISKPFLTAYGYNILKLIEIKPVSTDSTDVSAKADLQLIIQNDGRLNVAKRNLITKWLVITQYKKGSYNDAALWKYTDSFLLNKSIKNSSLINKKTILFSFAKENIPVSDWLDFVKAEKQSGDKLGNKPYPALMKEFVNIRCSAYYRAHLDDYDTALRQQLDEFNEANLLFAAMDKHVWSKAGADSLGLVQYYNPHRSKYTWGKGLSALIITANTNEIANEIANKIKSDPENWRKIIALYGNNASGDSSRFEDGQLPTQQPGPFVKGYISAPEKNSNDNTFSFIYVNEIFTTPAQRSFDDARGMVINDYQQVLEDKWIASLKERYPVKINEEVFESIR